DIVPARRELLRQVEGGLDPVARRRGDRDRRPIGERADLGQDRVERDQLVLGRRDQPQQRSTLIVGQRGLLLLPELPAHPTFSSACRTAVMMPYRRRGA